MIRILGKLAFLHKDKQKHEQNKNNDPPLYCLLCCVMLQKSCNTPFHNCVPYMLCTISKLEYLFWSCQWRRQAVFLRPFWRMLCHKSRTSRLWNQTTWNWSHTNSSSPLKPNSKLSWICFFFFSFLLQCFYFKSLMHSHDKNENKNEKWL